MTIRLFLILQLTFFACFMVTMVRGSGITVLPLRVDNPTPPGDGVVFIQLDAPNKTNLDHFKIITLDAPGQTLRAWDSTNNNCNGTVLEVNSTGQSPTLKAEFILKPLSQFLPMGWFASGQT